MTQLLSYSKPNIALEAVDGAWVWEAKTVAWIITSISASVSC